MRCAKRRGAGDSLYCARRLVGGEHKATSKWKSSPPRPGGTVLRLVHNDEERYKRGVHFQTDTFEYSESSLQLLWVSKILNEKLQHCYEIRSATINVHNALNPQNILGNTIISLHTQLYKDKTTRLSCKKPKDGSCSLVGLSHRPSPNYVTHLLYLTLLKETTK